MKSRQAVDCGADGRGSPRMLKTRYRLGFVSLLRSVWCHQMLQETKRNEMSACSYIELSKGIDSFLSGPPALATVHFGAGQR